MSLEVYCIECKTIVKGERRDSYLIECSVCGTEADMGQHVAHLRKCSQCGDSHYILGQIGDYPEYYATAKIICGCGNLVAFSLPVN